MLVWFAASLAASAQDAGEDSLDFVRKLRQKGYADLALEYLETLSKSPPPGKAELVRTEQVRTRLALAVRQDLDTRLAVANGRGSTWTPSPANPASPSISARHGWSWPGFMARRCSRRRCVWTISQPGKGWEAVRKNCSPRPRQSWKSKPPSPERSPSRRQNRLELAVVKIDQARDCFDVNRPEIDTKRKAVLSEAHTLLDALAGDRDAGQVGYLARAWLVKCALEQGNSLEASNTLNKLLDLRISEVAAARRLARDFELQFIWLDFEGARQYPPLARKTPLQKLQILAEKARRWVALYPTAAKTPDGYGVASNGPGPCSCKPSSTEIRKRRSSGMPSTRTPRRFSAR